jgi:hypothetical protein
LPRKIAKCGLRSQNVVFGSRVGWAAGALSVLQHEPLVELHGAPVTVGCGSVILRGQSAAKQGLPPFHAQNILQ